MRPDTNANHTSNIQAHIECSWNESFVLPRNYSTSLSNQAWLFAIQGHETSGDCKPLGNLESNPIKPDQRSLRRIYVLLYQAFQIGRFSLISVSCCQEITVPRFRIRLGCSLFQGTRHSPIASHQAIWNRTRYNLISISTGDTMSYCIKHFRQAISLSFLLRFA